MLFWAGILTGGLFTWLALRIGFYETLVMLFNVVISVYVSIFLTPLVLDFFPGANDTLFCNTFSLSIIAIGTFLILYGIAYTFLTGQFRVSFPKIFDILLAGLMGFLVGFLVFSFIVLVITVTPLSKNSFISQIGFNKTSQQTNLSYICWWCDLVNKVTATDEKITSKSVIDEILKNTGQKEPDTEHENNKPIPTEKKDKPVNPADYIYPSS